MNYYSIITGFELDDGKEWPRWHPVSVYATNEANAAFLCKLLDIKWADLPTLECRISFADGKRIFNPMLN